MTQITNTKERMVTAGLCVVDHDVIIIRTLQPVSISSGLCYSCTIRITREELAAIVAAVGQ